MAQIKLHGNQFNTSGNLISKGGHAPNFSMIKNDLSEVSLYDYKNDFKILNIFPSIDTGTCAASVRTFNKNAAELNNTVVINISMDLPFAQQRFCGAEGIKNVETASIFRSNFFKDYGLEIVDGPLKGLSARAVIVLNKNNEVLHSELVTDIVNEPNYGEALNALKK